MRNFLKIADGVDTMPLLSAIMRNPQLWNADKTRTHPTQSAHRVVDDILLRYNDFTMGEDMLERVCTDLNAINRPALSILSQAQSIIFGLMARVCGEHLGRVFISRMAPGVCIPPHTDRILQAEEAYPDRVVPAFYFERYQIALKAAPGVVFKAGDEEVFMPPGSIWWFNNAIEHSVSNHSREDRISMVLDIRPFTPVAAA